MRTSTAAAVAVAAIVETPVAVPDIRHATFDIQRSAVDIRRSSPIIWNLDNLASIGGHRVTVTGNPHVIDTETGRAIQFDGTRDGVFLDVNPLAGLARFTIEALFAPASDGVEEQRFLHFHETGSENRAMMETRLLRPTDSGSSRGDRTTWCLDTFLRHDPASLTLIDRRATHPTDTWHVAALVYDGRMMSHYVDRVREAGGVVEFPPIGPGRTSIGVRQNLTYYFKGRIRVVRITPEALSADRLMALPEGPTVRKAERPKVECAPVGRSGAQR